MKRGQLEQPFVYIFALVVAALVIFLGYFLINGLLKTGKQVETIRFANDLKNEINSIYDFSPGTNSNYKSNVPAGIKGICFIDVSNANVEDINYDDIKDIVGVLKDTGSDKNMFYSASAQVKQPDPIKIDKLKPKNNLVCKSTSRGILELDIENKGSFVEVS